MYRLSYASQFEYPAATTGIEVSVELYSAHSSVRLMAKIDTGASFCIFQREFAEALDIDVEAGHEQKVLTANSEFITFGHELDFTCLAHRTKAMVYFSAEANFRRNVLGRAGWLNQYRLGIIDHDLKIYISHYNDLLI